MAAYRADIEIGVKGIQQLQNITKRIEILSTGVDAVNKRLAGAVQSLSAYDANLAKASATLQKVNAGTIAERDAIRQYVQALGQANAARDRQNRLIQEQIALQRKAVATSDAGFGVQGPRQASAATAGSRGPGRFSNVVLGAGFPLLFGGGPGAVLGGAAGGLVGGPGAFAAQIGLSAVGQQLDMLVAATAKASTAFTSTSAAFEMMEEKSLFSSEKVRELAIQLEEQGKVSELSTLLTKELTDTLGNEGVKAMQDLGQTTDKTTKLWNQLTLQLQALIAGPLNGFLTWVNTALSSISTSLRFNALQRELDNNAEFRAEVQRRRAARGRGARLGSLSAADQAELIKQFGGLIAPKTQIPVTAEDLRTITAPRGAKGPKPPADRTAQLAADLKAMQLMSITQDGIRDALFEGNKELAIRLAYDQKVYDINRDTEKALMQANYETEKTVIRAQQIVRLKDAQLERDDELRELARDIDNIISETLSTLRGGITWDDTGMRDIFDMRLPDAVDDIKQQIKDLTDPVNQIIGAASAIGDAFAISFKGIASGTMTAKEALSNFFRSVGDYFIDMAARIAAEALKLQAIQLLQSLLSPLIGSGFGVGSMSLPGLEGTGALSSGNLFPGGAFAEGGFVTGPTRALIGEGGEPEYVIPQSKMSAAMSRYSRGARGESVIPGNGTSTEGGGAGTATMEPIDVRYSVERINNVDYVTAEQFQRGMAQAAQQGAAQGETRALRKLQMSSSTRRRVGI